MNSLLDEDTKLALDRIAKPLRDKIARVQNELSDTLEKLEKLQIKLSGDNKNDIKK